MRRWPSWLKVLVFAAATAVVAFPFVAIRWDQETESAQRLAPGTLVEITTDSLTLGLLVAIAGYAILGLRLLRRALSRPLRPAGEAVRSGLARTEVRWGLLVGLLVIAVAWPFALPRQHVNLAFETLIYMTLALGLNVIVGYGGLLVLGYAAFWAIGSYTFAILALRLGVNVWVSLPIAGCTAMAAGVLLGLPSLRLRGDYLAIVTLGFGEVVYYLLKTEVALTGGEMGLPNKDIRGRLQDHTSILGSGPLQDPDQWYWPALALVVLAVIVIRYVERSRVGRALVAMREDETAARCMGIDATRLKLVAFAFAAMWAGFAGVLWTAKLDFTNPMYFNFEQSVIILAMVVLGGLGSIPGAMIGALLLYAGPALMRAYNEEIRTVTGIDDIQEYRLLLFGALMVAFMIFRPQGLLGSARLKVELKGEEEEA